MKLLSSLIVGTVLLSLITGCASSPPPNRSKKVWHKGHYKVEQTPHGTTKVAY